jgi:glycosyltransferase involved in cell wall biosynthesis
MAKIVTVYIKSPREHDKQNGILIPTDMSYIRWYKISEALARLGHQVDMAIPDSINESSEKSQTSSGLEVKKISLSKINWDYYDVIKTLFNIGFNTLESYGGIGHPFIISKLGSVVGPKDMEGIYFYGKERERLYLTQKKINETSKYITVLNKSAQKLWTSCFGLKNNVLIVPGGVDRYIPQPKQDPYPADKKMRCIFAGHVYTQDSQPEANGVIIDKLNKLGELLSESDIKLFMIGSGDVRRLDERYVTYLGIISYEETWDFFYFAQVGVVVSAGKFMHNNESSKIYHYLRAGLPVVSESGFPNENIIDESKLGFVVENGNLALMAQSIEEAANKTWNRDFAINYILDNHIWDKRVEIYDKVITEDFNN